MLGLTGWFGWRWRQTKSRLDTLERRAHKLPVKAEFKSQFVIGWWKDPLGDKHRQVLIPTIWLEYEDGAIKPMEIKGLEKRLNMTIFPLGPISFNMPAADDPDG